MLGEQFTEYENGQAILKHKLTERELNNYRAILWDFLDRIQFDKLPDLIDQLKKVEVNYFDAIRDKMPGSQEIHEVTSKLAVLCQNLNQSPFASREHNRAIAAPYYVVSGPLKQYFNIDTFVSLLNRLYRLVNDRVAALEYRNASNEDSLSVRQQIMLKEERDALLDFHGGTATFEFWLGVVLLIPVLIMQKERIDAGKGMVREQLSNINISVNQESALAILLSPLLLIIAFFAIMLKKHVTSLVEKDMKETLEKVRTVQNTMNVDMRIDIVNKLYDDLLLYWMNGASKHFLSRNGDVLGNFAGHLEVNTSKLVTQNKSMLFAEKDNKPQGGVVIERVEDTNSARPT